MNTHYAGLLKFGKKEHMDNFFNKGQIFLNTFEYFKSLEPAPDGRGDPDEYLHSLYIGKGTKGLSVQITIPQGNRKIAFDSNNITALKLSCSDNIYTHLFCASSFDVEWTEHTGLLLDPRNEADGRDWVVALTDPKAFVARVKKCIESHGWICCAKHVEYVNKDNYAGLMGCFKKLNDYAYQNEWRVAVRIPETTDPVSIEIGSLADIALQPIKVSDLLSSKFELIQKDSQ